jgi:ABC-2 type transport system ATP-binding protein
MFAFETQNLVKRYRNKPALDGLDMHVPTRSIYGFLGINGAGKTTTFGIAGSFINATSGTIVVHGKLAVLPQDARFYYGRSVESQLRFFALLSGLKSGDSRREADKVLEQVDLTDKRKASANNLSHGMYKRLGIAQALLGSPDVLLLDEPTAGLDPENAFEIRNLIKALGKEKTIVVSSHNLHEIADICSDVGIIHRGRMVFEGKMAEITKSSSNVKYVLRHIDESILKKLLADFAWIEKFSLEANNVLHILFSEQKISLDEVNHQIIKALLDASIGIREIHSGKSLEETFLEIIGNK